MSDSASILIVDDDQEIRELLEENLANFGFTPVAVANGTEMFFRTCSTAGILPIRRKTRTIPLTNG